MLTSRSLLHIWTFSGLMVTVLLTGTTRGETRVEPGALARGAEIFAREWVPADPRSRSGDGLGPVYNETSCASCHALGSTGGAGPVGKNAVILTVLATSLPQSGRLVRNTEAKAEAAIHPGFRKVRSVVLHRFGVEPEYAEWLRELTEVSEVDSPVVPRRRGRIRAEIYGASETHRGSSPSLAWTFTTPKDKGAVRLSISERNTPPLFGAGRLDAVPVKVLEETAKNQPGSIRGKVAKLGQDRVGRFGWKAQTATLREFVLAACAGELGLEVPGQHQSISPLNPDAKPKGLDLSQTDCDLLIAYVRTLPSPVENRVEGSATAQITDQGRALFEKVGCAGCHTPNLGDLKGVYSDLLLHEMGQSLNDGGEYYGTSPGEGASPSEWRTPPLWGFRDSGPYLHDGRARTLDEAVAHHQGQAGSAAYAYFDLSNASRLRILSFLKTLVAPTTALDSPDAGSPLARRRRAETEQKLLDETLAEQRRAASETLAEARRVAEESRAEMARKAQELDRETQRLRDENRRLLETSLSRADSKLQAARDLERMGKTPAALEFYREIVRKFRDTEQGRAAAERIAALSK